MHATRIIRFHSREALIEAASWQIGAGLMEAASQSKSASLFLSGGSTPGPVYEALSKLPLPWQGIKAGLVDERWVDEDDKGSNAALIRRTLTQNEANGLSFTPMKTHHKTASCGQASVNANYKTIMSDVNIAILGMGTDGHVCSWFPESEGLEEAVNAANSKLVQAITAKPSKVTGSYLERMTLTYSALKQCQMVLLLITGEEKISVLNGAIERQDKSLPVSHLMGLDPERFTIFYAR